MQSNVFDKANPILNGLKIYDKMLHHLRTMVRFVNNSLNSKSHKVVELANE